MLKRLTLAVLAIVTIIPLAACPHRHHPFDPVPGPNTPAPGPR